MLALKSAINAVTDSNIEAAPTSVSALAVLRSIEASRFRFNRRGKAVSARQRQLGCRCSFLDHVIATARIQNARLISGAVCSGAHPLSVRRSLCGKCGGRGTAWIGAWFFSRSGTRSLPIGIAVSMPQVEPLMPHANRPDLHLRAAVLDNLDPHIASG